MPDSEEPAKTPEESKTTRTLVELTESEYHVLSDVYLDYLVNVFEDLQDQTEGVDVEFAVRKLPRAPALTLKLIRPRNRPASSPLPSPTRARTSSTNSRPTSRSGCRRPSVAPSATTGS